jgi:zinc transporter ZupT
VIGKPRRPFSLRALLLALALVLILPISIVAGLLLARSAKLERAQLEGRLLQVADDLAADIDRDLSNRLTTLQTLASSPALQSNDLAAFHAQASAAVAGWGSVFLVDPYSMQQVVNTLLPWGTLLPKTGDLNTVQRVSDTGEPQVSDYFVGVVSRTPTFNVDYPIFKDGKVRYVLLLGLGLHELTNILRRQRLNSK